MKKVTAVLLAVLMLLGSVYTFAASAAQTDTNTSAPDGFTVENALYVHAVSDSDDTQAWQAWQSEHDEDFNEVNSSAKYFFLPSSASDTSVDIYNAYNTSVTVNGTDIPSKQTKTVNYNVSTNYNVSVSGKTYVLKFMKSNAEAAIYINNSDADGNGTPLMDYLNVDKSRSAKASGAIVTPDGTIDNTEIKKIKGRGNSTWDKPKKAYNITYDSKVSIAEMSESKKYSLLANYQDDSLSRNRFLYDLSDAVGMPYASDSRYVDFYANGFYWGSYQITEKVEAGGSSDLVNDIDDTAYLNDDGTINEDFPFLCEVDSSAQDGEDYYVRTTSGNKVTIKCPELSPGDTGYDEVKEYVKKKFDAFFNAVKSKTTDLTKYADVDSLTKLYLINELSKNWDSGVSSLFFVYKQDVDGQYKFFGSPVWDFDNSLGNATGVESELRDMGVNDYEEYSGWWCKYKGKSANSSTKSSSNIMNNMARNNYILDAAPQIWFEEFVPVIEDFKYGTNLSGEADEMYSADKYYSLLKDSAEMNYQSGWLIDTGSWICDHSSLTKATFDMVTKTYQTDSKQTSYSQDFAGMYDYCCDWLTSRAAWLSSQMIDDYTPTQVISGDIDGNNVVDISDVTALQKYIAGSITLDDLRLTAADVNNDNTVDVTDVTYIQKFIAKEIEALPVN